jgi:hypothetical protein
VRDRHPLTGAAGWHTHEREHDGKAHAHRHKHPAGNSSHGHAHGIPVPEPVQPEQVIDMTGRGTSLRYVEIITRGGVVRVNTNLLGVHDGGREYVTVEVTPSTRVMPTSGDGGHWHAEVTELHGRTDIALIREGDI